MRHQVIQQLFERAVDILFPPSPDLRLVRSLHEEIIHELLAPQLTHGVYTLTRYDDPRVRALIHEAKFHQNPHALMLLSSLLVEHLKQTPLLKEHTIIPMPLSRARLRARGYNQVFEMLRYAQKKLPQLEVRTQVLRRVRDTRPQTTLAKTERLTNMQRAFEAVAPQLVCGKQFVLIDDVMTTGATMHAAKAALLPHAPASVTCIALAH